MEIITYVLEGALAHKDNTGASSIIRADDLQRMSAGTGISHSEYNPSPSEPVHFLQIWIVPDQASLAPAYEQRSFELEKHIGTWVLVAASSPRDGAVRVHQDVELSLARLSKGQQMPHWLKPGRRAWLQVVRGEVMLNGTPMKAGDGAAVSDEKILELSAIDQRGSSLV
jgi:quercetin 2,3-dioxygenase